MSKVHDLEEKERTKDVLIDEQLNFNALLLSELTLNGLQKNGFQKPSPIQLKAIPLGKCGFDLIVKSKSGTGKTLVFGLVALEAVNLNKKHVQALILAPTREIAVQIQNVLRDLASGYSGLNIESFIGGLPIEDDVKKAGKCHIAVGAPGRVRHLIQKGALNIKQVKIFVLDEVDKLIAQNGRVDIDEIMSKLPSWKQTIAVSATLSKETEDFLEQRLSSATLVEPTTDSPLLLGIRQFVDIVKTSLNIVHQLDLKNKELIRLLSQVSFSQCLVFMNYQTRAASVCNHLNRHGWNSLYISADQKQTERLQTMEALKSGKCKILLSTDLTARGIDASNVDLTINYDIPYEASTYLHRMGRAGRFGTKGLCITIATEEELGGLKKLLGSIAGANFLIARLPKHGDLPGDLINLDIKELQFEQSVVDLVNVPQENRSIFSSIVDIKNSKIPKPTSKHCNNKDTAKIKEESRPEGKESISVPLTPTNTAQCSDFQTPSKINIDANMWCFSQATITPSDTTLDRTEMSENLENPDLKSLLTTLDVCSIPSNFSNATTDLSVDSTKKRKRKDTSLEKSQEAVCNKNITLLHVAELLNSPLTAELPNETKSSIDQFFVNTFKTCDEAGKQGCDEASIEPQEPQIAEEQNPEEQQIADIFKLSYDYAVKPGAPNWVEALGIELEEKAVLNEAEPKEVKSFHRSPNKRHKSSKHRKRMESKYDKLHKPSNNSNVAKQTKNIHLNTSFADDSYSNTLTDSVSNHTGKSTSDHQIVGSTRPNLDSPVNKSPMQNQFQGIDKHFHPTQCDHDYSGNQHYIDCFQRYSDELTQKLQTFEDMATFERWYEQWQWQVQSVREYVQQNIYIQEMNRYMYGSK